MYICGGYLEHLSVLDVELDLVPELLVVTIAGLELEVHQQAEVVVETEQLILLVLVLLENLFEVSGISRADNISRSTVEAVTVHWCKWLDVDVLLLTDNTLTVVESTAVVAFELVFLNSDHDIVGQADMDEGVHATAELLEHLGLLDDSWEVSEHKAISTGVGQPEQLKSDSILDHLVDIASVVHLLDLEEKWVIKLLGSSSELADVHQDLLHRDNWETHIDTEPGDDLVLIGVWCGEEHDLWVLWPSA